MSPCPPWKLQLTNSDMATAVPMWFSNKSMAEQIYGLMSCWETSKVTDLRNLFCGKGCDNEYKMAARSFNHDISTWDTSRVTIMSQSFHDADAFNRALSSWDTSSVTTMSRMFYLVKAFNQPLSFDTSRVTDMNYMFAYASAFNQPLSFDTSNVASMTAMFRVRFAR